jgi:hypothetical protein
MPAPATTISLDVDQHGLPALARKRVDNPEVSAAEMTHDDSTTDIWLADQTGEAKTVTPVPATGGLTDLDGGNVTSFNLEPFGVTILTYRL